MRPAGAAASPSGCRLPPPARLDLPGRGTALLPGSRGDMLASVGGSAGRGRGLPAAAGGCEAMAVRRVGRLVAAGLIWLAVALPAAAGPPTLTGDEIRSQIVGNTVSGEM